MDISALIARNEGITHLIRTAEERDLEVVLDTLDETAKDIERSNGNYWMRYNRDHPDFVKKKLKIQ